jgi:hypothetical protein
MITFRLEQKEILKRIEEYLEREKHTKNDFFSPHVFPMNQKGVWLIVGGDEYKERTELVFQGTFLDALVYALHQEDSIGSGQMQKIGEVLPKSLMLLFGKMNCSIKKR